MFRTRLALIMSTHVQGTPVPPPPRLLCGASLSPLTQLGRRRGHGDLLKSLSQAGICRTIGAPWEAHVPRGCRNQLTSQRESPGFRTGKQVHVLHSLPGMCYGGCVMPFGSQLSQLWGQERRIRRKKEKLEVSQFPPSRTSNQQPGFGDEALNWF